MKTWKIVSLTLLALVLIVVAYGVTLVRRGFSALATPSAVEELAATTARKLAVPSSYRQLRNPLSPSAENIRRGMAHFADHCATCHANDGGGQTVYGKGLYPKPPDLRAAGTQNKSDGELYYTIDNGVRLSGMPAFRQIHTPEKAWRLIVFIRHLPQITPEELNEMKGLNRKIQANFADF
ncbi:MAG TPA: cytochrome c [Candidatus Angelobacter sp.]|nr:cytochrome c [Candidatus Angelobacter sp.]